ncbi:MAG: right-handed parallel beta-helix repeat-containing protein, partial [Gammaproteobacteria bacterium]|nr:right-handed parallel beta-helix repeat-containing protein [Gammaproteobacteria bacterium]
SILLAKDIVNLVDTNGQSNIIIEDLAFRGGVAEHEKGAIFLNHAKNINIRNNEIYFSKAAIYSSYSNTYDLDNKVCIDETADSQDSIENIIEDNDIHDNLESGIYLKGFSRNNTIQRNKIHNNYVLNDKIGDSLAIGLTGDLHCSYQRSGNKIYNNEIYNNGSLGVSDDAAIAIYSAINTDVTGNRIWSNDQSVFYFAHGADNSRFSNNLVYGNKVYDGYHLRLQRGVNMKVENNTVYDNYVLSTSDTSKRALVSVSEPAYGNFIRNNIFSGNVIESVATKPTYLVWLENENNVIGSNLYFNNISSLNGLPSTLWAKGKPGSEIAYNDLEIWKSGNQKDLDSLEDNPLFIDQQEDDFHLSNNSPAINAGANIGLTTDFDDNPIDSKPDIGAFENQDPDNDGLNHIDEIQAGTDLLNPDTDNDGLNDGAEMAISSNPLHADSDRDGIRDGDDIDPLNIHFPNPEGWNLSTTTDFSDPEVPDDSYQLNDTINILVWSNQVDLSRINQSRTEYKLRYLDKWWTITEGDLACSVVESSCAGQLDLSGVTLTPDTYRLDLRIKDVDGVEYRDIPQIQIQ